MTAEASGGLPFFGQDMNGILYMITANIAALAAGALPAFNAARASAIGGYPVGALVARADGTGYWLNQSAGNSANPDTSSGNAGWAPVANYGAGLVAVASGSVALPPNIFSKPIIILEGTLTGNLQIVFPAGLIGNWIIVNIMAGAFTISAAVNGGSNSVTIPAGSNTPTSVYSDGGDLWNTGVSTAGLAPINSPALTGTPTAPTAPTASNSTQIGTTAFVKAALAAALATYAPLASPTLSGVPTAPTPATSDDSAKLATTAFVKAVVAAQAATQIVRSGIVALTNGSNSVAFSPAFPNACTAVTMTPVGAGATYYLTGLPSKTGFTCNVGVTQDYFYIATGN
jgi:hypothetical protein